MSNLLQIFILLPLLGALISLGISRKNEKIISQVAISIASLHVFGFLIFLAYWLLHEQPILDIKHIVFFHSGSIEIFIDFYFDKLTAVFGLMGSVINLLVTIFSRFYLHRDEGFKRFFMNMIFFFLAYNLIVFSGNFETLFVGWEILGISSFLLIAFYRDRYLPVKNAFKVGSFYRLGDIGLILTMWMSHQLWHSNITFLELSDMTSVHNHLQEHFWYSHFIALMLLLAAAIKSAQVPFSSWLPRAMEGPTASSAIFYGSLSVHLGVFLLLRTFPYWESIILIKVFIAVLGLSTSLIATTIARVQSSVKVQIAYSSCAQIGLMFIEVALGLHGLALVHFAGNSFLRTYQLLVSPSQLSYSIHDMVFSFIPSKRVPGNSIFNRIEASLYILSVKEWHMDTLLHRFLWSPFKWIGTKLKFLTSTPSLVMVGLLFLFGLYCDLFQEKINPELYNGLPQLFSFIALLLILRAFSERGSPIAAWLLVIAGQMFIALSIALYHDDFGYDYVLIYLGSAVVSSVVGFICLRTLKLRDPSLTLNQLHGHVYEYPGLALIFLMTCLSLVGLPFTPAFIGIDLLFSHIHRQEELLILFTAMPGLSFALPIAKKGVLAVVRGTPNP